MSLDDHPGGAGDDYPDGAGDDDADRTHRPADAAAADADRADRADRADHDVDGPAVGEPSGLDRPRGSHAAYAINWKTVLVLDAAMGLAVVAAGFIALVVWSFWLGAFLIATGCAYTGMVVFRADQWRRLRRDAGL